MDTSLFDYHLPPERIAQHPMRPRDHARLLVLQRQSEVVEHRHFYEIADYVRPGDLFVLNDTKVFRARLSGKREGNGSRVDVLLLREQEEGLWETLVKPGRRAKTGTRLSFGDDSLKCEVVGRTDFGGRLLDFSVNPKFSREFFMQQLREWGLVPLPPYIKSDASRFSYHDKDRDVTDDELYQTIYAEKEGSVAAPTAGFHFTKALMEQVEAQGAGFARITLHVGLGTFRPVKADHIEDHVMHDEYFSIDERVVEAIAQTRKRNGRVIAVGTTSVRALESCGGDEVAPRSTAGWTSLFISPGYRFRYIDALITNFHLPRSTLLILACAFAGREKILRAYREAVQCDYRFYSFGDAMLIL